MGAWTFILPRLLNIFPGYVHYAGRPASASTGRGHDASSPSPTSCTGQTGV